MQKKLTLKNNIPYIVFFVLSIILTYVYFYKLKDGEFLFIADQLFRFSYYETFINSFFVKKIVNFGAQNGWQLTTQFWDVLYFLFVYKLGASLIFAEKLAFFMILFLSQLFSYTGFKKFSQVLGIVDSKFNIILVTLWYCFNPYTLALWHGGAYNLGTTFTYALAPYILYYFHLTFFSKFKLKNVLICALLLFLASFTFWLFASLLFFLTIYWFLCIVLFKPDIKQLIKSLLILLIAYIPMISFILFNITYEFLNKSGYGNPFSSPTFGNQQGGLWYSFLLIFSWGIYTVWTPRHIYSFGEYFFTTKYIVSVIFLYILTSAGVFFRFRKDKSEGKKFALIFIILFLISIFFSKASQPPLGELFLYLYQHLPFFKVFRSADIRFGFPVVLALTFLLLYASAGLKKLVFGIAIILIMLVQSIFLFNGVAIYGEEISEKYFDRIMHFSQFHNELEEFFSKEPPSVSYVLSLPSVEYGHYLVDKDEHYVGQDLVPKIIKFPLAYFLSTSTGMLETTYFQLEKVVNLQNSDAIKIFPIKYIVIRKDAMCDGCLTPNINDIQRIANVQVQNDFFDIYTLKEPARIIQSDNYEFKAINPVKYVVRVRDMSDPVALSFLQSFDEGWKIYKKEFKDNWKCENVECAPADKFFNGNELKYLIEQPLFADSHSQYLGYANSWIIDPVELKSQVSPEYYKVNESGTVSAEFVLFYHPQTYFYLFSILSIVVFTTVTSVIITYHLKERKK